MAEGGRADPKSRSKLGLHNLHNSSARVQNYWASSFWILTEV